MKKVILVFICHLIILQGLLAQVSFSGTVSYTSTPADAWDGISADCNISINLKSQPGGLGVSDELNGVAIKSLRIRQKEISSNKYHKI